MARFNRGSNNRPLRELFFGFETRKPLQRKKNPLHSFKNHTTQKEISMNLLENASKTAEGVMLNGFLLSPVVERCAGCDRVRQFESQEFCSSYPDPTTKWVGGRCNFATHIKAASAAAAKVNPLKASKRAAKGR
jgi:hypothetical protein